MKTLGQAPRVFLLVFENEVCHYSDIDQAVSFAFVFYFDVDVLEFRCFFILLELNSSFDELLNFNKGNKSAMV